MMSRGNRRMAIFKDHTDYMFFLEQVSKVRKLYPFKIHSLCLMSNHFHMSLETMDTELWKIMQKMLSVYAEEFNYRHGYTGHLFEGRYKASLLEDERYFLEVSRYIHLNPVKAAMVREPLAYDYSSYRLFVNQKNNETQRKLDEYIEDLVDTSRVLSGFRNDTKEQYRMFVEGKISHAEQEMLIQKDMKEDDMWLPW